MVKLLLAEVARIQPLGTIIHADMHDIVIVHVLHLHTVIIECPPHHLIACGIDGDIPVITHTVEADQRIRLHLMRVSHHRRRRAAHIERVGLCIVKFKFVESDQITVLVTEAKDMGSMPLDGITRAGREHQRIVDNLEIGRHTGGVSIEDRVTGHTERGVFRLSIDPHALHQSLRLAILL